MAFNLDSYEPVADRIHRFWEQNPNGAIHTDIVLINDQQIVIKATIYRNIDDTKPAAIDFAQEYVGGKGVNATSWAENCATSAIGRALADLNFQPKKDGKAVRPSREEMTKAAAPARSVVDYVNQAIQLHDAKDVEGLRELYKSAVRTIQPKETLDLIKEKAESLK